MKLNTTELAELLDINRAEFVKNRSRYEKKLLEHTSFEKEGKRQSLVYVFPEGCNISIENKNKKIEKIFGFKPKVGKTMDRYLNYIHQNLNGLTIITTDVEVAAAVGDYKSNITTCRRELEKHGFISPLEEYTYYSCKKGSDNWQEITSDEWNEFWRLYYKSKQNIIDNPKALDNILSKQSTDKDVERVGHLFALREVEMVLQKKVTRIYQRNFTFLFLEKLEQYFA